MTKTESSPAYQNTAHQNMTARAKLFDHLSRLQIETQTIEHPAFFTVEESAALKAKIPEFAKGHHSKNLFLKDKKGNLVLITAKAETKVDLVAVGKALGMKGRLSFGKPELLFDILGVTPGSVNPFSIMMDTEQRISHFILDEALSTPSQEDKPNIAWYHPMENTASTAISFDDLCRFAVDCGHAPKILNLSAPMLNLS